MQIAQNYAELGRQEGLDTSQIEAMIESVERATEGKYKADTFVAPSPKPEEPRVFAKPTGPTAKEKKNFEEGLASILADILAHGGLPIHNKGRLRYDLAKAFRNRQEAHQIHQQLNPIIDSALNGGEWKGTFIRLVSKYSLITAVLERHHITLVSMAHA